MTTHTKIVQAKHVPENRPVVIGLISLILIVGLLVKVSAPLTLILGAVAVASLGLYSIFRQFPVEDRKPGVQEKVMDVPELTLEEKRMQDEDLGNVWMLAAIPLMIIPFFLAIFLVISN